MRKIRINWDDLEKMLKNSGVVMEDDKTIERIKEVTLVKPRVILVHTEEIKK